MTGLDCLREELIAKGFTKSQANSRVLIGALDILCESNGKYADLDKLEKDIEEKELELKRLATNLSNLIHSVADLREKKDNLISDINSAADERYKADKEYIETFYEALKERESPEGRDVLKNAQMFVNSVNVNTAYDNTAFIVALGSILSQNSFSPMEELRKINPKMTRFIVAPEPKYKNGRWLEGDGYRIVEVDGR